MEGWPTRQGGRKEVQEDTLWHLLPAPRMEAGLKICVHTGLSSAPFWEEVLT